MSGSPGAQGQLRMLWPTDRQPASGSTSVPDGYLLRTAGTEDVPSFRSLMAQVELGTWDDETLAQVAATVVPSGWLVVVHEPTDTLVATGMAQQRPIEPLYPDGYEVGWIAAHPAHGGRGLGRAVTAAAAACLVEIGASCIYLQTDDFRLPAIKTYLRLGFVPHLWADGMEARWQEVCERLSWPFTPKAWQRTTG